MPISNCSNPAAGLSSQTQWTSVQALNFYGTVATAPAAPDFVGKIQHDSGGTLLTSFAAEIWLASGPGPVYTDEVRLVRYEGSHPVGVSVDGGVPIGTILPNAGRVWSPTTDAYAFKHNAQFSGASSSSLVRITFQVCTGAVAPVTDCCAETLAKLDQLLGFVSAIYSNQP